MIDRSLRVRDDLVADSASYNMLMTTGLRADLGPTVWGNWTLDAGVEAGMVGVVDPVTGTFELHKPGAIPLDVEIVDEVRPATWSVQSASVEHAQESIDADVRRDTWRFPESHTIVSRGTQYGRRAVVDPVRAASQHHDLVRRWADDRGYATSEGILQGFGIVTATYQAVGVVNLAALKAHQTFTVEGRADGLAALVGDGDPYIAGDASYQRTSPRSPANVESFVYPCTPDRAGPGTVPYAFEFLSFAGRTALPGWVGHVPTMSVSFRNSGSYVVQCTVTYDTGTGRNLRKRVQVGCGIPGWVYLPVDATNVRVSCRFWHVDDWGPRHDLAVVSSPMQEWRQGQGAVEIQGWWPGDYDAAWVA
jgi:hypothetical protein